MLDNANMKKAAPNTGINPKAKGFGYTDYIKITILGFALSALWSSLHTIIMPLRLLGFVPEAQKNTYLGILTFTGLILAMVVQPIAGAIQLACKPLDVLVAKAQAPSPGAEPAKKIPQLRRGVAHQVEQVITPDERPAGHPLR